MALGISKTPSLKGKEAKAFLKRADANKYKCASPKEVKRALKIFENVLKKQGKHFIL